MRSPDQLRDALLLANQVRVRQAQFRAEIAGMTTKAGVDRVATAIENDEVESFQIGRLVMSIRSVAHAKMTRLLISADIRSSSRRVGALTPRQSARLVSLLRQRAW